MPARSPRSRLDVAMTDRGLVESRTRAQSLIMARRVRVNQQHCDKPGTPVQPDDEITIDEPEHPYVGRGGMKLAAALAHWNVDLAGKTCLDVGASTGGFTDCMLQNGARRVYAIDVGHGQLDQKLREDPRVVAREKVNARFLDPVDFPEPIDFVSIDVSFISLTMILPSVQLVAPRADVVMLIKPQFEVGRADVGKGGIVRDEEKRREAVGRVIDFASAAGWEAAEPIESPIRGAEGNVEYLCLLRSQPADG